MTWLDLIILAVLGLAFARGFSTGLIRQVMSLAGQILAFVLALQLMRPVGAAAASSLGLSPTVGPVVGFIVVFLAVQLIVFALVRVAEGLVGVLKLSAVNRLLGAALGAVKGAVVLSVLFMALAYVDVPGEPARRGSVLYRPISTALPTAWNALSTHVPGVTSVPELFDRASEAILEHMPAAGS